MIDCPLRGVKMKDNNELLAKFDEYIRGHQEAKKVLINLFNRSQIRYQQRWVDGLPFDELIEPGRVLLIGESGSGKTESVNVAAMELFKVPILFFDATQLSHSD